MAKCQNIEGYWKCDCLVGYEGDGYNGTCRDIDECQKEETCEKNSVCINTPGGNICDCNQGKGNTETFLFSIFIQALKKPFFKATGNGSSPA